MDTIITVFELVLALAAVGLVLYLSYIGSKFLARKVGTLSNSNNIKIVERVSLTQDKGLAIVEIGSKFYLVGFSTNTVEILQELNKDELDFSSPGGKPMKFLDELTAQIKSRMDLKISAKEKQRAPAAGKTEDEEDEK